MLLIREYMNELADFLNFFLFLPHAQVKYFRFDFFFLDHYYFLVML